MTSSQPTTVAVFEADEQTGGLAAPPQLSTFLRIAGRFRLSGALKLE